MNRFKNIQMKLLTERLEDEKSLSRYMTDDERREALAEKLLENNVIALPCGVGDLIYKVDRVYHCVRKQIVTGFVHNGKWLRLRAKDVNKAPKAKCKDNYISIAEYMSSFFLTKNEAEEEMKRRKTE